VPFRTRQHAAINEWSRPASVLFAKLAFREFCVRDMQVRDSVRSRDEERVPSPVIELTQSLKWCFSIAATAPLCYSLNNTMSHPLTNSPFRLCFTKCVTSDDLMLHTMFPNALKGNRECDGHHPRRRRLARPTTSEIPIIFHQGRSTDCHHRSCVAHGVGTTFTRKAGSAAQSSQEAVQVTHHL